MPLTVSLALAVLVIVARPDAGGDAYRGRTYTVAQMLATLSTKPGELSGRTVRVRGFADTVAMRSMQSMSGDNAPWLALSPWPDLQMARYEGEEVFFTERRPYWVAWLATKIPMLGSLGLSDLRITTGRASTYLVQVSPHFTLFGFTGYVLRHVSDQ